MRKPQSLGRQAQDVRRPLGPGPQCTGVRGGGLGEAGEEGTEAAGPETSCTARAHRLCLSASLSLRVPTHRVTSGLRPAQPPLCLRRGTLGKGGDGPPPGPVHPLPAEEPGTRVTMARMLGLPQGPGQTGRLPGGPCTCHHQPRRADRELQGCPVWGAVDSRTPPPRPPACPPTAPHSGDEVGSHSTRTPLRHQGPQEESRLPEGLDGQPGGVDTGTPSPQARPALQLWQW